MRKLFIAGNWKMNMTKASAVELAQDLKRKLADVDGIELAVCPSFVYLDAVCQTLSGGNIGVGGQDVYDEPKGAFTGEISTDMLRDIGCRYCILGHSERRHVIGETDDLIHRKVKAVLGAGLVPILCVGETLEERKADQTEAVVETQLTGGLGQLTAEQVQPIVIAYEPVWAIGTGLSATPDQAQDVHRFIRGRLEAMFTKEVAEALRIQYGGSVKPSNAADLLGQPDIDGALVGGASLKAEDFEGIVRAGV